MIKIKIISVGKTKESWLESALQEYTTRLSGAVKVDFLIVKDDSQLLELIDKETSPICLDSQGKMFTSEQFASFIQQKIEKNGSRVTFVIGGAEGLPESLKKNYELLSLSPMTFTHQMVRLLLIEQLYRYFEIAKGSPYHK